jgi:hypothetical protein
MTDELERVKKESAIPVVEVLSGNWLGETKENNGNSVRIAGVTAQI